MKYRDRSQGSIEAGSLLMILFISALLSGLSVYAFSGIQYVKKNTVAYQKEAEIKNLLRSIVSDMQIMVDDEIDYPDDPTLLYLENKYEEYGLTVTDASSGYHLDFMPDALLSSASVSGYLFLSDSSEQYLAHRNAHGFSPTKESLEPFVERAVLPSCAVVGWLNVAEINTYAFKAIAEKFKSSDADGLFPLVNALAMMNVNMMKPDAITPLLYGSPWGLKNVKATNEKMLARFGSSPVDDTDIRAVFGLPELSRLYAYLGCKTAFWELSFTMHNERVTALVAGIPESKDNSRKIAEYRLVDWSMRDEP